MSKSKRSRRRANAASGAAPGIRDIMNRGWSRQDAEHLAVLQIALDVACSLSPSGVRVLASHAAIALAWEPVRCGAHLLLTDGEEQARAWRVLAGQCDDSDARTAMLHLAAEADGRQPVSIDRDDLGALISEDDVHLHDAAMVAEAAGEFERAAGYLRASVRPVDDGWLADLEQLAARGDDLDPDAWGRWIASAALRWCLTVPVGFDAAMRYAVTSLTLLGASPEIVVEQTMPRAMQDPLIHDLLLFDESGLRAFLDQRLAPHVAQRVPRLPEWTDTAPSLVLLQRRNSDASVTCRDLVTDRTVIVGDTRFSTGFPLGTCFYGRLVPVDHGPTVYYALPPTAIPESAVSSLAAAIRDDEPPELRLRAALAHLISA